MTGRLIHLPPAAHRKNEPPLFERRLLLYGCAERMRKASGEGRFCLREQKFTICFPFVHKLFTCPH